MADLDLKGKDVKDVKAAREGEPPLPPQPNPDVVEVTVKLLEDGHTLNLAVKVAQPDGTSLDQTVTTQTIANPLVFRLKHLQEALVRAKVTHVAQYDAEQSMVTSKPLEEVYSPPAEPSPEVGTTRHEIETHRPPPQHKTHDATHTARR